MERIAIVIPAKAWISAGPAESFWTPAFAGVTE
jgi:hypothetical protein